MEWQPIETYHALKKKPRWAAFLFKAEGDEKGRIRLGEIIELTPSYGYRTCTHWLALPQPPRSE